MKWLLTILTCGEKHGLISPITQLDGIMEANKKVLFTFKSEYGVEDTEYSLSKILPEKAAPALVSRVSIGLRSADRLCTLELKEVVGQNFVWPRMNTSDTEVIREIQRM